MQLGPPVGDETCKTALACRMFQSPILLVLLASLLLCSLQLYWYMVGHPSGSGGLEIWAVAASQATACASSLPGSCRAPQHYCYVKQSWLLAGWPGLLHR